MISLPRFTPQLASALSALHASKASGDGPGRPGGGGLGTHASWGSPFGPLRHVPAISSGDGELPGELGLTWYSPYNAFE